MDTPEVVWPDGEPVSKFEDDPAVIALREAHVQEAIAWNALDYSDPDLVYRWGLPWQPMERGEDGPSAARDSIDRGVTEPRAWTALGPNAVTIYDVTEPGGASTIVACRASFFSERVTDPRTFLSAYRVEFFDDGSSSIEEIRAPEAARDAYFEDCKAEVPIQGYFHPEPEPFSGDEDDIKRPAPAEEYGFDNVS